MNGQDTVAESANGQIGLVTFTKDEFTVPAVIKKSNKAFADNLMYEYKVGIFLNKYCSIFPCFIYTYGIYTQLTFPMNLALAPVPEIDNGALLGGDKITMKTACDRDKGLTNLYLVVQYVQKAVNFHDFNHKATPYERHCVLYQIYFALCLLYPADQTRPYFEHNDLNYNNVLVKELQQEILFTFKMKNTTVQFKTKYLAKMIDYGRCNYYENPTSNSLKDMEEVCGEESLCSTKQHCGYDKGFLFIYRNVYPDERQKLLEENNYYPDSQIASYYSELEETLFEDRDYPAKDDKGITFMVENRFSLKGEYKDYKVLLDKLSEIITYYDPYEVRSGFYDPRKHPVYDSKNKWNDGPTLVIDGINPMVFTPHGIPIDAPFVV